MQNAADKCLCLVKHLLGSTRYHSSLLISRMFLGLVQDVDFDQKAVNKFGTCLPEKLLLTLVTAADTPGQTLH